MAWGLAATLGRTLVNLLPPAWRCRCYLQSTEYGAMKINDLMASLSRLWAHLPESRHEIGKIDSFGRANGTHSRVTPKAVSCLDSYRLCGLIAEDLYKAT